ncbi:MAG: hypothetical protein ACYSUB_01685 [Planctomycetota bacterium]|jgi:hypothetical protein
MSLLNESSLKRIRDGKIGGDGMVELFEMLAADADVNGIPVMTLMIPYIDDSDEYVVGKYVPELHLVVRKIND